MKYILAVLLFAYCSVCLAQDTIVTRKGEEFQAKVLEINLDEIKYKRIDNPDGPLFTLAKADVFMIKYANGTRDVIKLPQPKEPARTRGRANTGAGFRIDKVGERYYQNNVPINERSVLDVINLSKNKEAMAEVQQAIAAGRGGKPFIAIGIPLTIVGGVITSLAGLSALTRSYSSSSNNEATTVLPVSITLLAAGIPLLVVGSSKTANKSKHMKRALQLYNDGLAVN